jgi:beta-N-acetylhexosaminidase
LVPQHAKAAIRDTLPFLFLFISPMASRNALDLRQQVGQLLILGFDGTDVSARLRSLLGTMQPGGIILFKRNIEEAPQVHALLRYSQHAVATPMFLCVDMEGGTVDRLRDVIAPVPSVADVAATGSKKLFRTHGKLIGDEVRALGFNTDFAPCIDLGFAASRKVLGSRTVSANPRETIRYAREFLRGLQDARVIGCGKHFPGLGEGNLDSHVHLPTIDKRWKKLWREDLRPYRKLNRDLPMVMVAHAAYPVALDTKLPASLSKKWITRVLKKQIGYRGLVVSDDLEMGGVLSAAPIEDAAVQTLVAGSDLILSCHKEESVWRAYEAIYKRAEQDSGFASLILKKSTHVLDFKKKSSALRAHPAPRPTPRTVDRLCRRIWVFAEEVRLTEDAASEAKVPRRAVAAEGSR